MSIQKTKLKLLNNIHTSESEDIELITKAVEITNQNCDNISNQNNTAAPFTSLKVENYFNQYPDNLNRFHNAYINYKNGTLLLDDFVMEADLFKNYCLDMMIPIMDYTGLTQNDITFDDLFFKSCYNGDDFSSLDEMFPIYQELTDYIQMAREKDDYLKYIIFATSLQMSTFTIDSFF